MRSCLFHQRYSQRMSKIGTKCYKNINKSFIGVQTKNQIGNNWCPGLWPAPKIQCDVVNNFTNFSGISTLIILVMHIKA